MQQHLRYQVIVGDAHLAGHGIHPSRIESDADRRFHSRFLNSVMSSHWGIRSILAHSVFGTWHDGGAKLGLSVATNVTAGGVVQGT